MLTAAVALLGGLVGGWFLSNYAASKHLEKVVAMSWGDGKYGPAFYGAHVYLEPRPAGGFSVRARVYLGRGNDAFHDCGELGVVKTDAEAVAQWGKIDWREDGLRIGSGTNHYFLPRARLESHR